MFSDGNKLYQTQYGKIERIKLYQNFAEKSGKISRSFTISNKSISSVHNSGIEDD